MSPLISVHQAVAYIFSDMRVTGHAMEFLTFFGESCYKFFLFQGVPVLTFPSGCRSSREKQKL